MATSIRFQAKDLTRFRGTGHRGTTPRWSMACLLSLVSCGCAVHWRDSDNVEHHAGLLVYRCDRVGNTERLLVWSFGVDIRLSGQDAGVTFGMRMADRTAPERRSVTNYDGFADAFYARLTQTTELSNRDSEWGCFHLTERITPQATLIGASCIGVDAGLGEVRPGLCVGYGSAEQYSQEMFEDGTALLIQTDATDHARREVSLWRLQSMNSSDTCSSSTTRGFNP